MTQDKALAILKSGRNVFLTGSAGAGKTYVLNQYIKYLKERKIPVAVTASTGIAATHLSGLTIHSWAGIGIRDEVNLKHLSSLKSRKYFREKLEKVKVLIIDEISMLHRRQLELVNRTLKFFKENELPFGGIQVIFSGDFFQLPPIGYPEESSREKFAFMADAWLEADVNVCFITEQHRQENNPLNFILNEIRSGKVSQKSIELLENRVEYFRDDEHSETKLYTHNADVDRINQLYLSQLGSASRKFKASTKGNKKLVEMLKKSVLAEVNLELKTGAQVMFIRNNYDAGYINGTLGQITGFSDKAFPMVRTKDNEIIEAKLETWAIEDEMGKSLASFTQIPLKLAWAVTIHKSQGMTLDGAVIDLSKAFEKGQGYVALSRLRDLNGLKLLGLNQIALEIDNLALKADKRFQELSNELDEELDVEELKKSFKDFVSYCGGIIDEKEIIRQKKKSSKNKAEKVSTYRLTKELVIEGFDLEEIAEQRGLTKGTILSHIIRIAETDKEVDLTKFKPEEKVFKKVKKAISKLSEEDRNSLKKIHEFLKGEVPYDEIKKALIFLN